MESEIDIYIQSFALYTLCVEVMGLEGLMFQPQEASLMKDKVTCADFSGIRQLLDKGVL